MSSRLPVAQGCGGGSYEDFFYSGITFLQSDLSRDSLFKQYYYDVTTYRSESMLDSAISETKTNQNLKEWEVFFKKTFTRKELEQLVYTMTAKDLEQQLKKPVASGGKLARPENRPALEYLLYAKRCEPYVIAQESDWGDGYAAMKKRREPAVMRQLMDRGLVGYDKVTSAFLKARYAYQVIRLANYADFDQECVGYYEKLVPPLGKASIAVDWALRLKAGSLRKAGKEAESLVHTSLLFDQSRYLMDEACLDFYIPRETVWEQSLKLAGQKHRQATLWLLRGLKEERFMIGILEQMAELEPQTSRLEMMLVRYINRLEQEYFGSYLFFGASGKEQEEKKATALKYCTELQDFLAKVDRAKVHDPALWDAVAAYLNIIERKHRDAESLLEKAAATPTKNMTLKNQIELLKGLNALAKVSEMTPEVEQVCVDAMSVLEKAPKSSANNLEQIGRSFYTLMAQKYLVAGDTIKGYLCLAKAKNQDGLMLDGYFNSTELDLILSLIAKQDKSPFEKGLTAGLPVTKDDLYSVKGTYWLRQENFKAADASFSKVSAAYWARQKKEWEGWDSDIIPTCFDQNCYDPRTGLYRYPKQGFTPYTKQEFARKVTQLEALAVQNPAKADQCYFQIANAFFHSPGWSYNDNLDRTYYYEYDSPFSHVSFFPKIKERSAKYSSLVGVRKTALKYYVKAMKATKNKEFAARCCFMAQACMTEFSHYQAFQEPGKDKFYYLGLLKSQYSDTQYFKQCLKECDTLKQYLNPNAAAKPKNK